MICNECETVAHCTKHGCIPKQPEYKDAIEVSVIFHEGQRMFAVPKQPAQQEPVAILNHAHGIHTVRSVKLKGLPDGEYNLYTSQQPAKQEPVAWLKVVETLGGWGKFVEAKPNEKGAKPVYTSPPAQRTWVGLTAIEYDTICGKHSAMTDFDFLEDIEAKLKEKNT